MKNKKIIIGVASAIILLGGGGYLIYNNTHFHNDEVVYGVELTGMTPSTAYKEITNSLKSTDIEVINRDEVAKYPLINLVNISEDDISEYKKTGTLTLKVNDGEVDNFIDDLNLNEGAKSPTNARIISNDNKFEIRDGEIGDEVNIPAFKEAIINSIDEGKFGPFKGSEYLTTAKITKDDKSLNDKLSFLNDTISKNISFKVGDADYKLTKEQLINSVSSDEFSVDKMTSQLASNYSEIGNRGKDIKFKATNGKEMTFTNNIEYSWKLDDEATAKSIIEAINRDDSDNIVVDGITEGKGMNDKSQFGGNYVEVDLNDQHAYIYKDNKKAFDWPIITGMVDKRQSTDPGLFEILYKQRDTTLKGTNNDGSAYASPVSYWIPITWEGIGIHDSPWQPEGMYGNDTAYKSIGSHGCINTSPSVMPTVWDLTYEKMPVIVHGDIYDSVN